MARENTKSKIELEVMVKSRRRCAFCFGLDCDTSVKKGQIAHIDQNSSNSARENLVFLCLSHHDEYDSRTSQSKGLSKNELKHYRAILYEYLDKENTELWTNYEAKNEVESLTNRQVLSLDVYNEKIAMYRIVRDFLGLIMRNADIDIESLFKFAKETDEVIFLFDPEVSVYLREIYKKAVQLRYTGKMIGNNNIVREERSKYVNENSELLMWFGEQVDDVRHLFTKHIAL